MHIIEKSAGDLSELKVCSYVVYMWQYEWEITVFLVHLISEETNLIAESLCLV
jgi:hypothetical protein